MTAVQIVALVIFIIGYIGIIFEHPLKMNKSAFALLTGCLLWVMVGLTGIEHIKELIHGAGYEIFEIVIFLLAAMSLVEILIHYRFFDWIKGRLTQWNINDRGQFVILLVATFLLSAVIDNLTATLVMIQIARKFFWDKNLLITAVGIVISANAGGAWSPVGDVTTLMLWLAGKFTSVEIITGAIIPSILMLLVVIGILRRRITSEQRIEEAQEESVKLSRGEKIVITITMLSFTLPLLAKVVHLPPYFGLLAGVAVAWLVVDMLKKYSGHPTHTNASIENLIQKTDISSLKFFIGILFAVSALGALGVLDFVSAALYGVDPSTTRIISSNVIIGLMSSILDNIPLTAIAIDILQTSNTALWVLLAITVGTGGSLLVVGSAAGVVAMGMVRKLTFMNYLKIAWLPALLAYAVGVGAWYIQHMVL